MEINMKQLVQAVEVEGEGLEALLGKNVTIWCECYIYTGELIGVNSDFVKLRGAKVVYETGLLTEPGFKDAQPFPADWYVRIQKIESYGEMS